MRRNGSLRGFINRDVAIGLVAVLLACLVGYYVILTVVHSGALLMAVGAALLLGGAGLYLAYARPLADELRALGATQRLAAEVIREMQAGDMSPGGFRLPVEVRGVVELEGSAGGQAEAWACRELRVELVRPAGNGQASEQVHDETRCLPFWVRDPSGRVKVLPEGAQLELGPVRERFVTPRDVDGSPWADLLRGLLPSGGDAIKGFRVRERRLEAGARVRVVGMASDARGELDIGAPERMEQPFVIASGGEADLLGVRRRRWAGAAAASAACVAGGLALAAYGGSLWAVGLRSGEVFVRNETDHLVRLLVDKADGSLRQAVWTYAAHEGTAFPHGTRLERNGAPLQLQPGDAVALVPLRPDPPVRLAAGAAGGFVWSDAGGGWRLALTEALLKSPPPAPAGLPSVATPASAAPLPSPGARALLSGRVYVKNRSGRKFVIEARRADGSEFTESTWTYAPYDGNDRPRGTYLNLKDSGASFTSGDRLRFTWTDGARETQQYVLGVGGAVRWDPAGYWTLYVGERLAPPLAGAPSGPPHTGRLYVRNLTAHKFSVEMRRANGARLYENNLWSFDPYEGKEKTKGFYLNNTDTPVELSSADYLRFFWKDKPGEVQTYVLDGQGPVKWHEGLAYWSLEIGDAAGASGNAWLENQTSQLLEVRLLDAQGQIKPGAWTLEPGARAGQGIKLAHQGEPVALQRGDVAEVTVLRPGTPVEGEVGRAAFLKWNGTGRYWQLTLSARELDAP